MTEAPTCPICEKPTPDGPVCSTCADELGQVLDDLPAAMAELEVTVLRQTTSGPGGARGVGHEYALPFAEAAADFHWSVRNTVAEWARTIVEQRYRKPAVLVGPPCSWQACYCMPPYASCRGCDHSTCRQARHWLRWQQLASMPVTFAGLCRWTSGQVEWLRHQQFAGEAFAELLSLKPAMSRWLDRRGWVSTGVCHAVVPVLTFTEPTDTTSIGVDVIERQCGTPLRLYDGAKTIRCRECGREYDAGDQDQVVLLAVRSQLGTAAEIARVLNHAGVRVTAERLRKWASRRQLTPTQGPADPHRAPPLYRFGDVLGLIEAGKTNPKNRHRDAPTVAA